MIKSSYYLALGRCSVPAPSIAFRAGGWLAIAGQLRGKGRDRVSAAEPEENILVTGVAGRESGVEMIFPRRGSDTRYPKPDTRRVPCI